MKRVTTLLLSILAACGGGAAPEPDGGNCIEDRCFVIDRFEEEPNDTTADPVGTLGSGESAIIRGELGGPDLDRFTVASAGGGNFIVWLYLTDPSVPANPGDVTLTGSSVAESDSDVAVNRLATIAVQALPGEPVEIVLEFDDFDQPTRMEYRLEIHGPF